VDVIVATTSAASLQSGSGSWHQTRSRQITDFTRNHCHIFQPVAVDKLGSINSSTLAFLNNFGLGRRISTHCLWRRQRDSVFIPANLRGGVWRFQPLHYCASTVRTKSHPIPGSVVALAATPQRLLFSTRNPTIIFQKVVGEKSVT